MLLEILAVATAVAGFCFAITFLVAFWAYIKFLMDVSDSDE